MKDIIYKKKLGKELSDEEIRYVIEGYTKGDIPDFQMSALAMAICFQGMSPGETVTLTDAMMRSGDTLDMSFFGGLTADKHSTGGVGDKTSLIVAPLAASLGVKVAKMSGRGLGHTGGTVDKLESIEGFRTTLSPDEFQKQVENVGVAVIGQSLTLAPADKKLYSLRDITATVESIPLIASSIMSKKLAAGADSIVLDVKCGSGAFMKDIESARALARSMVDIGRGLGRKMCALITNMDEPLGYAVGNSLEVIEAVSVLKGESHGNLRALCVALASHMASMALDIDISEAQKRAEDAIDSGAAFAKMKEWVSVQGGNAKWLEDTSLFPKASALYEVRSERDGYVSRVDAETIGRAACTLGAGRTTKDGEIDHAAGIILNVSVGGKVKKGDILATLHANSPEKIPSATDAVLSAFSVEDAPPTPQELIYEVVS